MTLLDENLRFPFGYCAARYLRCWESAEQGLHSAIRERPSDKGIGEALSYFRVARNFQGLSTKPGQLNKIRQALHKATVNHTSSKPAENVESLAKSLQSSFEKRNISASSKLLWLVFRSPYIVYDSRSVRALGKFAGHKNISGNYHNFEIAWRSEYLKALQKIREEIKKLPTCRPFMPASSLSDSQLRALASQPWFTERVFDIFLWEVGAFSKNNLD